MKLLDDIEAELRKNAEAETEYEINAAASDFRQRLRIHRSSFKFSEELEAEFRAFLDKAKAEKLKWNTELQRLNLIAGLADLGRKNT
jgi:hypothetical protein